MIFFGASIWRYVIYKLHHQEMVREQKAADSTLPESAAMPVAYAAQAPQEQFGAGGFGSFGARNTGGSATTYGAQLPLVAAPPSVVARQNYAASAAAPWP